MAPTRIPWAFYKQISMEIKHEPLLRNRGRVIEHELETHQVSSENKILHLPGMRKNGSHFFVSSGTLPEKGGWGIQQSLKSWVFQQAEALYSKQTFQSAGASSVPIALRPSVWIT